MNERQEQASELRRLLVDLRVDIKALDRLYQSMDTAKVTTVAGSQDELLVLGLGAWSHLHERGIPVCTGGSGVRWLLNPRRRLASTIACQHE